MKKIKLGNSDLLVPNIALGCMRMDALDVEAAKKVIKTALEQGINFFDHADMYGGGESELIFGEAIKALGIKREEIIIQSKCGIRKGLFDFSKDYITQSVDGILQRLGTDYLDVLVLHRPDALFDPDEVSAAFKELKQLGKVKHFGVSNQNSGQIELLRQALKGEELLVNQLQFSIMHTGMIDSGMNVNMRNEAGINRDDSILEYCRLHNITIQAWSPFQYGFAEGVFLGNENYPELNTVINQIAAKYNVTNNAIAVAWILRHPAKIQTIIGTMNPQRIRDCAAASELELTREEWYEIYLAAGNVLL